MLATGIGALRTGSHAFGDPRLFVRRSLKMNTLVVAVVLLSIPVCAVLIFVALIYNILVYRKNAADNVFSTVDVMLKKRYDLIPNLVETVKGYASHEKETLAKISEMRAKAVSDSTGVNEKINLDGEITNALGRIFAIAENYPNLKANEQFLNLQKNLSEMEEQIAAARRAYNAAVTDFNNSCEMFPTNIFASLFKFEKKRLFQVSDNEKQPVKAHS